MSTRFLQQPSPKAIMDIDFEAEFAEEFHEGLDDQYDTDVIARLKKASQAIKTKRRFTSEDVDDFFLEHGAISGVSPSKDAGNLLHSIVDVVKHNEINPEHVELLLRRLVERYPDLLKYPNKDGHNPIFMAIRACQHQLVDYMVSSCLKDKSVAIYQECLDDVRQAGQMFISV
jgi:ribosomal protein S15P/S13E